jgi:UDP-N-acetylglucosamine enolpyruvyl transferase
VTLSPTSLPDGEAGIAYNQTITASGGSGSPTLALSNVSNNSGLTIDGSGTSTITVSGTPTTAGPVSFTVTPSDSSGPGTAQNYSFTVAPAVTLSPSTLPDGTVGTAYNQTITPSGGSGTVTLTLSNITNNSGMTIAGSGTGTIAISGTPTTAGPVSFTVTPSDSVGTGAAQNFTLNISAT